MSETNRTSEQGPARRPAKRGMNVESLLGGMPAPVPAADDEDARGAAQQGASPERSTATAGETQQPAKKPAEGPPSPGGKKSSKGGAAKAATTAETAPSEGSTEQRYRVSVFLTEAQRSALRIKAIEHGHGTRVTDYVVEALGLPT